MARNVTLLDLLDAVSEFAGSDAELVATVVHMVNSGKVRLCGAFRGARFDASRLARMLDEVAGPRTWLAAHEMHASSSSPLSDA